MVAELISVGTEILLGNITNTNASYLAEQCAALGLSCYYQVTVGDNSKRLKDALITALSRADIVILTGGLGPTDDDLTKETAAAVFHARLVQDEHTRQRIENYLKKGNYTITENNWKQALVPEGCKIVDNDNGTAPGLIMTNDEGQKLILLPGPPGELYPMFEHQIRPYLAGLNPQVIYSRTVKISGKGESLVADEIDDLLKSQENPTIAPYAKTGEVHLRITARAVSEKEAKKMIRPVIRELKKRFGANICTTKDDMTLEGRFVELLQKYGLTVACAESCTGGLLTGRLVNVAGASDVLMQSAVTYANEAKREILGVPKRVLKKYGAVSPQTAKYMAEGAAKWAKADVALSVTGIAGPGGGTPQKPVGLVYIGCCINGRTEVIQCHFNGNRMKVREAAVAKALDLGRRCVMKYAKKP